MDKVTKLMLNNIIKEMDVTNKKIKDITRHDDNTQFTNTESYIYFGEASLRRHLQRYIGNIESVIKIRNKYWKDK